MGIFKRLTDDGRESGFVETMEYDPASDQIVTRRSFDNEPVLLKNKEMRAADDGYSPDRSLKRVASIPVGVAELWLREHKINVYDDNDTPKVLAMLDDPEWSYLKTADGRASHVPIRHYYRASTSSVRFKEVKYGDE